MFQRHGNIYFQCIPSPRQRPASIQLHIFNPLRRKITNT
uniref:Uncharacterized protein n=1 Tax=Anguilla anguilla TaxID=7936 RepID=A0A0E9RJ29_ANGAN